MFVDAFLPARIVCIRVNLGRFLLVLWAAKPHVQVGNVHQKIPVSSWENHLGDGTSARHSWMSGNPTTKLPHPVGSVF